jgi:hypothetical protein
MIYYLFDYIFCQRPQKLTRYVSNLDPAGSLTNWPRIRKDIYGSTTLICLLWIFFLRTLYIHILCFLILDHRHPHPRNSMKLHFNVKNFARFCFVTVQLGQPSL